MCTWFKINIDINNHRSEFPGCTRWRTKKFNSISPRAGWKHIKYWLKGPAMPVEKILWKNRNTFFYLVTSFSVFKARGRKSLFFGLLLQLTTTPMPVTVLFSCFNFSSKKALDKFLVPRQKLYVQFLIAWKSLFADVTVTIKENGEWREGS